MTNTPGRTALITGSTGFLGGWVVAALRQRGFEVIGLARPVVRDGARRKGVRTLLCGAPFGPCRQKGPDPFSSAEAIETVCADLIDTSALAELFKRRNINVVVHLAAQTKVLPARDDPMETFETNVKGTWCLLEAIRRSQRTIGLVLSSTDAVYGESGETASTEDSPVRCLDPYATSKACAERLAMCYHETFGVPCVVARCSNLYGPGDPDDSRIVPGTIRRLLRGEPPQIRGNGQELRDYLFVADAAAALALLAENVQRNDVGGGPLNIASGQAVSVLEMVQRLARLVGRPELQPRIGGATGEISRRLTSADRIRSLLGWSPRLAMDEALRRTVDWYRQDVHQDR